MLSYTDHVPLEAINKELSRHESNSQQAIIMELSCAPKPHGKEHFPKIWSSELNNYCILIQPPKSLPREIPVFTDCIYMGKTAHRYTQLVREIHCT